MDEQTIASSEVLATPRNFTVHRLLLLLLIGILLFVPIYLTVRKTKMSSEAGYTISLPASWSKVSYYLPVSSDEVPVLLRTKLVADVYYNQLIVSRSQIDNTLNNGLPMADRLPVGTLTIIEQPIFQSGKLGAVVSQMLSTTPKDDLSKGMVIDGESTTGLLTFGHGDFYGQLTKKSGGGTAGYFVFYPSESGVFDRQVRTALIGLN